MPRKKCTLSHCACEIATTLENTIRFHISLCLFVLEVWSSQADRLPTKGLFYSAMKSRTSHPTNCSSSFDKGEKETNQHIDESNWAQIFPALYIHCLMCQESQCHFYNDDVGGFLSITQMVSSAYRRPLYIV